MRASANPVAAATRDMISQTVGGEPASRSDANTARELADRNQVGAVRFRRGLISAGFAVGSKSTMVTCACSRFVLAFTTSRFEVLN